MAVCLHVQLLNDKCSASKSFYRFLVTFSDLQNNALFSSSRSLLKEQCVAKLVHGVLLLYLVVSSALER